MCEQCMALCLQMYIKLQLQLLCRPQQSRSKYHQPFLRLRTAICTHAFYGIWNDTATFAPNSCFKSWWRAAEPKPVDSMLNVSGQHYLKAMIATVSSGKDFD
jgi:hypothetical protein